MRIDKAALASIVLRLLLGWFMLVDGIQILMTPGWTAAGFLQGAKTFPAFYAWFALPINSWWVDPLNAWGIVFVGVAFLLGIGVRPAAWAGAALMLLYYFPHYVFPTVPHGYIVEEHIIDAAAFVFIAFFPPAHSFGIGRYLRKTFLGGIPVVRALL